MKVTIADMAGALGVSRQAAAKRAKAQGWQPTGDRVKGGGNVYELDSLPLSKVERRKLQYHMENAGLAEINTMLPATSTGSLPVAAPSQPAMLPEAMQAKAMAKADLLRLYLNALATAQWGRQVQARDEFMAAYNSGIPWPTLYSLLGRLSWKTIEGWKRQVKQAAGDTFTLADHRGLHRRGTCSLTPEQTDILLRCALHPNRPRISEAIRMAHSVMRAKGISNGHSDATYRRWLASWVERNHHIWVFSREGAKAWNDQCAVYIERDYSLINVGDIIVADGHTLNFEVLNPWTGKAKRMALIVWLDMKSAAPLGWEIMPTEDTAAISSALRRAILALGKIPQVAYLDNGRAFRSRFFKGADFDEMAFAGLYERLGMKVIHAWPYHGQSKTVERFFQVFAELERWCPSYTGTSIEHKPPRLNRGERLHRRLHEKITGNQPITLEQAHRAIAAWFDAYMQRPQRGHLDGATPAELLEAGRGPGIDKAELIYLMMSYTVKTIHRNGISFQGRNYYHPALNGRRHQVTVRYDLQDTSAVYVFDQAGEFICEATPVQQVHPAAAQLGTDADRQRLVEHIELKKTQEKEAALVARQALESEVLPDLRRRMEEIAGPGEQQQLPAPAKVVRLDAVTLAREVAENLRYQQEAEERDFRERLLGMDNSDRYEALLELEAQGVELAEEWIGFMAFFPSTSEYTDHIEYWEQRRMAFAIMYRGARAQK